MGISVSLDKIVDAILSRNLAKRTRIADYLDAIADDAQLLAELWEKVWIDLQATETTMTELERDGLKNQLGKVFPQFSREYRHFNERPYGRLEQFYYSLSLSIGGQVPSKFHERFAYHLASLINTRDQARAFLTSRLQELDSPFVLHLAGGSKVIRGGQQLIEALYTEAAGLNSLAKQYRATS